MTSRSSLAAGHSADGAAGFVLAGGHSVRMGRDKALVELAGRPLIAHALDILQSAGLSASIAGARFHQLAQFAPVIPDSDADKGPLAGICAALAATSAQLAVFLPVDAPFLPPALLTHLLRQARTTQSAVTVASLSNTPQTFPAVLHRKALSALQSSLMAGQFGCMAAFQSSAQQRNESVALVPVEELEASGTVRHPRGIPACHWFHNLNCPADLARAAAFLNPPKAVS